MDNFLREFACLCLSLLILIYSVNANILISSTNAATVAGNDIVIRCLNPTNLVYGDTVSIKKYTTDFSKTDFKPGQKYSQAQVKAQVRNLPTILPAVTGSNKVVSPFSDQKFTKYEFEMPKRGVSLSLKNASVYETGLYCCKMTSSRSDTFSKWLFVSVSSQKPIVTSQLLQGNATVKNALLIYNSTSDDDVMVALRVVSSSYNLIGEFSLVSGLTKHLTSKKSIMTRSTDCGGKISWKERLCYTKYTYFFQTKLTIKENPRMYHMSKLMVTLKDDTKTVFTKKYGLHDEADVEYIQETDLKCSNPYPYSRLAGESLVMWCQFPSSWLQRPLLNVAWRINQDVVFAPMGHVTCVYPKDYPGCGKGKYEVTTGRKSATDPAPTPGYKITWAKCDVTESMLDLKKVLPDTSEDTTCSVNDGLGRTPFIRYFVLDGGKVMKFGLEIQKVYSEQLKRTFQLRFEGLDEIERKTLNREFKINTEDVGASRNGRNSSPMTSAPSGIYMLTLITYLTIIKLTNNL